MRKINWLILILALAPSVSEAVPSISGANVSAASITITGSGFGSKSTAAPLKFEQFEVKDGGGLPTVTAPVPTEIAYWTGRGGTYTSGLSKDLTISDTKSRHSGSQRAAEAVLSRAGGTDEHAQQIWHNSIGFSTTGKVYVNMWIYWKWAASPVYLSELTYYQVKSFNISTSHAANGDPVRPYLTEFVGYMWDTPNYAGGTQSYHRNGRAAHPDQSFYYDNNSVPMASDGWYNVVIESVPGTNDDDALITDGWRIISITNPTFSSPYQVKTETNKNYLDDETKGVNPIDSLKIGWYLGANLEDGEVKLYYDDIYMDNTFQRVEIGDNATYANCTKREIQPPTAWADGEITVSLNSGSFAEGATAYVFTVDADNVPSSGHEITIPAQAQAGQLGITPSGGSLTLNAGGSMSLSE